jgi:hypothetical protein
LQTSFFAPLQCPFLTLKFFHNTLSSSLLVVFVIFFVSFFQNKHTSFTKALAKG